MEGVSNSQGLLFYTTLSSGNRTPTPATSYIHSVISGNKSETLKAVGGSVKGKKGVLLLVLTEWRPFTLREACLLSLNNGSNFLIIIE